MVYRRLLSGVLLCILCVGISFDAAVYAMPAPKGRKEGKKTTDDGPQSDKQSKAERRARQKKEKYRMTDKGADKAAGGNSNKGTLAESIKPHKQDLSYPDSKNKRRYNICVIVPLYLDELVRGESVTFKDQVPDKAADGLAFYQGVKLASDSLERAGARLDVHIYDAGSFSESPEMLIHNRKFDSADLIIGAVEQHDVPVLAGYARKKRINFVSALSNYDGWVKDNQYLTMLQPTIKSHCEYIIDELSRRYAGQNVTLLYRTSSLADDNAALYMLNDLYADFTFRKLQCNSLPSREALATVLDTAKPNVVAVSILDPAYADSILATLARHYPDIHFEVFGMPAWNSIATLKKPDAYRNIAVNVTYPFNFALADSALAQSIRASFRAEFGGVPSEMVYRGYEAMLWYGNLLRSYGTIFNDNYTDISGAPFTKFRIKPRWDPNGRLLYLENRNIYLSTYQGGRYMTR